MGIFRQSCSYMGKFISGILFSLLFLLGYVAYPQEIISQFDLNPSPDMRLVKISEEPIFLLDNFNRFRLVYLSNQLQHLETITIDKGDPLLYKLEIRSAYKRGEIIHVLMREQNDPYWYMLNIDEKTKTSKLIKPEAFLPTDIRRGDFINLNSFVDDDRFYLFQIIEDQAHKENIRIFEIEDSEHYTVKDFSLPIPDLFKRFKRQQWVLPEMTNLADLTIPSSACPIRFYIDPSAFILTFEMSGDNGQSTEVFTIDRTSWALTQNSYVYPKKLSSKPRPQFNSFIFKKYLFQAQIDAYGLYIFQKERNSGKVVNQHFFQSDEELGDFFSGSFKQVNKNYAWKTRPVSEMMEHLSGSHLGIGRKNLGIFIRSLGPNKNQLTVGTHLFPNRGLEQSLQITPYRNSYVNSSNSLLSRKVLEQIVYSAILNLPPTDMYINQSHFEPSKFRMQEEISHKLIRTQDKIFFLESDIQIESFKSVKDTDTLQIFEPMTEYSKEHKLNSKIWGTRILVYPGGYIFGYGRKKQYQFVQFPISEDK